MDSSARPKYCSVATALKAPGCDPAVPPWDLSFTCPFALQAPRYTRHNLFPRCASYPGLHIAHSAWQQPGWLGRVGDATSTWVLARREPDGFYYRAQIKAAPELERQGTLLVEFEAPLDAGSKLPSQRQSVVLKEDVIQLSSSMEYSLRPGDKVLAPWEPDRQRYGPGTVLLGLEMAGTQRDDLENELEMGLPQRLMVDSMVNTDPILPEESPRQSGFCRPEWRYWRRNGPEPHPGKPGTRPWNIRKEKDGKQERAQTIVRTTKQLTTKATNMTLPQTLPEGAEP
ncbi:uncharacterized protein C11orf16 homolog isoform X3 [Tupaia chinensis]|uniref:uncharacterized protein C11orf16 homolog isoform X3 n=1 Tax=Tupaia chinensis TaxID=246437 RepID=UPI0003C91562|nr:uncharacterized protein C11orf16 homolog isoform X3 [Tupaia chinensis]